MSNTLFRIIVFVTLNVSFLFTLLPNMWIGIPVAFGFFLLFSWFVDKYRYTTSTNKE